MLPFFLEMRCAFTYILFPYNLSSLIPMKKKDQFYIFSTETQRGI